MYTVANPSTRAMGGSAVPVDQYSGYRPRQSQQSGDPSQMAGSALNLYKTIWTPGSGAGTVSGNGISGAGTGTGAGQFGGAGSSASGGSAAGVGALGWIGGIGAAAAVDQIAADNVANIEDNPYETHTRNARGLLRYGGSSPLTTSLIERGLGEKGREIYDKVSDPTGIMVKVEQTLGHGVANTVPQILGGTGNWDPIGSSISSYLMS